MTQNVWCKLFNFHKYETLKEEELKNPHGILIGKVIISRCTNCGKIKSIRIYTETSYGRE